MMTKPKELLTYRTQTGDKLYILICQDFGSNCFFRALYAYQNYEDTIAVHDDFSFIEYKIKMFVEDRNLELIDSELLD